MLRKLAMDFFDMSWDDVQTVDMGVTQGVSVSDHNELFKLGPPVSR